MAGRKDLIREILAGAFFLLGVIVLFVFIFTIGRDKGLTEKKFQISILFRNVGGLTEGAPVRLAGVNIGTVSSIEFLEQETQGRRVKVELNIFEKFRKQLNGSVRFTIKTEGLLGEKLVEIYDVAGKDKLDLSRPVIGEDPFDVQDLAVVFSGAAESFTKTSTELSKIDMIGLTNVMTESSEALLTTSNGINGMLDEMQEIILKSKRLLDRVEQKLIDGNLFKVF